MQKEKIKQRIIALLLSVCMILGNFQLAGISATAADSEEEPILTIACLSDLHNQMSLITGDVSTVRLRGTVTATLNAIKEQEKIDMMILCGDYTSDASNVSEENWLRIRELMVNATRDAFPDDTEYKPVIWVDGNHDYEIAREYNAGDYYTFPMKEDIGELPEEDCYYESTYDGSKDLLAAYYYKIFGFDFLCLNTGNFIYDNPNGAYGTYNSYRYSKGSVEWVEQKLVEIYENNPNKTVFFVTHIPFDDSNGINKGKGMDETDEATILLKKTLAHYPNLIHLYGHDHGKDSAYIRNSTAQRVTQYDMDGNKMTDEKISPCWKIARTESGYSIQNAVTGEYLGYEGNMNMLTTEAVCQLEKADTENGYYITVPGVAKPNLYFSTSSNTFSANKEKCELQIYEQTEVEDGTYTFAPASEITDDGTYAIVKKNNGKVYALTNQTNGASADSLRLTPSTLEESDSNLVYTEQISGAAPSFITSFVGSMRYYSSSIDGGSSPNDSKVVQALMVYIYKDRVELQMKNYGSYEYYDQPFPGNPSIVIAKNPIPYITYRKVYSNNGYTADLSAMVEEMDVLSLEEYSAASVKAFAKALAAAKNLLLQDPADLAQEEIDQAMENLQTAKNGLVPAPQTEPNPPETETEPRQTETNSQVISQPEVKAPKLTKPVLKATVAKNGKVKLSWKKQGNASGYQIQMKGKKGSFKTIGKLSKNTKVKLTVKKLKKGAYKFRMRSYANYKDQNQAQKTVWSKYSKAVTIKIKK